LILNKNSCCFLQNPFCSGCYNDCIQELEDFPIFPPRIPSSSSSSDNGIIIMIKINSEQRNANPRCSLCWEDFTVEERVADFPCNHIYHDPCIVTWFQTNNNCPICIRVFFCNFLGTARKLRRNPIIVDGRQFPSY
jgi:hypothetical protein